MDIPVDKIAIKVIWAMIFLSIFIMVCGVVFIHLADVFDSYEALPFAIGVAFSLILNIVKVFLLKRTVKKVADMSSVQSGKRRFYMHYFSQLGLTVAVLLAAAYAPDNIVNAIGTVIGLFTFKISMHLMQIFVAKDDELSPEVLLADEKED